MVLRARKVAGKPTVAIPQTAGRFSGVRFRGTERPSRYRLLDREVEAGHHPNDGRRRHQFPASNGLSRCSGQSRALMKISRRRWDLRPYPTPGCRDSPGLPALQTLQIRPGIVPPGPTPEYVPHWRRSMTPNTRRPVRGHARKRRIFITICFIEKRPGVAAGPRNDAERVNTHPRGRRLKPPPLATSPHPNGSRCRSRGSGPQGRPDERRGWTRPGS